MPGGKRESSWAREDPEKKTKQKTISAPTDRIGQNFFAQVSGLCVKLLFVLTNRLLVTNEPPLVNEQLLLGIFLWPKRLNLRLRRIEVPL